MIRGRKEKTMNIFYVYEDPTDAAVCLPDKLVVKMPLESAQMLCTAHRVLDGENKADKLGLYKIAMKNHPCTIWVREADENYYWLYEHFNALCKEYQNRYGREHLSYTKLNTVLSSAPSNIDIKHKTVMPQAMPDEYKCQDTIKAYRDYMVNEKHYAQWNKIPDRQPEWWVK
tara:strand:- start:501 stop:1016 length:516 start_codon:yes stop_codon:yes gene_type:complete